MRRIRAVSRSARGAAGPQFSLYARPRVRYRSVPLSAFRYYFGQLLRISGFALVGYVTFLFFNPMNKEAKLLSMTVIGMAVFAAGQLLLGSPQK